MKTVKSIAVWLGFAGVCFGVAWLGGMTTAEAIPVWYAHLKKPACSPPDWVFAPVWTVLYLMMATAAWKVLEKRGPKDALLPLLLFFVQLLLNAAWSWLFFGMKMPGAALAEILVLWCAILATLISFRKMSPAAGWLMVPYLLWVSFAAALNFLIWQLNR